MSSAASTIRTNGAHALLTVGLILLLELWQPRWRNTTTRIVDVGEPSTIPSPQCRVRSTSTHTVAEVGSVETSEVEQLASCTNELEQLHRRLGNLTVALNISSSGERGSASEADKKPSGRKRCRAPRQRYTGFPTTLGFVEVDFMPSIAHEGVYVPFPQQTCVERTLQWLQRQDHLSGLDVIGWSKSYGILGLVIVTDGKGNIWSMEPRNDEFRGQDQMTFVYRYARQLTRETIFFMTMNDVDVWYLLHGYRNREQDLRKLLKDCPLWYLHWNPRVNDHGRLEPRTIPIPDPYVYSKWLRPPPPSKPADKAGRLVYRGATLGQSRGMNRDFYSSDRFKCVRELQKLDVADVKFHQYTWGLPEDRAPWRGAALSQEEMAQQYGAVLDVDGNANTWEGLRWKMGLGGAVFKADSTMGFIQWYYPELETGKHLFVFNPEGDWDKIRAKMAKLLSTSLPYEQRPTTKMGLEAHEFAKTHFTREAMRDYIKRTILYIWENETALGTMDWRIRDTDRG